MGEPLPLQLTGALWERVTNIEWLEYWGICANASSSYMCVGRWLWKSSAHLTPDFGPRLVFRQHLWGSLRVGGASKTRPHGPTAILVLIGDSDPVIANAHKWVVDDNGDNHEPWQNLSI
jgi:hypothetical protein